jgi:DHA3 family macrolide efflux protein-like MFS transporter
MNSLRTFYILVITQTLSMIGSRMTGIAIGIWVFNHTGSTSPLLLTAFFNEVPGMLGSSLAGVLVDRWDRRRVLMLADAGQAVGSLLLLVSFLSGNFQLWHLYAVVLLQGVFAIFQGPAKDASTTMLVPEAQRERANAIQQMAFPLAGVIAPALTGVLYAVADIPGIILIDLTTFVVAVGAVYLARIPQPPMSAEGRAMQGNVWREMAGGFRFLRARPALLLLVGYFTAMNFLLNGPLELAIPYLITVTGSEAQTGILMGVMSLGAFVGAGIIAVWSGTRPRVHTYMPAFVLTGVMFVVYGTTRATLILGLSSFLLMIPLPLGWALFLSIVQAKTPPDIQGRVFATISQLGLLASTTSFLLTGPLIDQVLEPRGQPGAGMASILVVTGVIIIMMTLAVYAIPSIRQLESRLPNYAVTAIE